MKPSDILLDDPSPQRVLITSRAELRDAVGVAIRVSRRTLRFMHRDLSVFDLGSVDATEALTRLLLGHRNARVRLLVGAGAGLMVELSHKRTLDIPDHRKSQSES